MTTTDPVFPDDEPVDETELGPSDAPPGVPDGSAAPGGDAEFEDGAESTHSDADDEQL